jgi:hypothetical protein
MFSLVDPEVIVPGPRSESFAAGLEATHVLSYIPITVGLVAVVCHFGAGIVGYLVAGAIATILLFAIVAAYGESRLHKQSTRQDIPVGEPTVKETGDA